MTGLDHSNNFRNILVNTMDNKRRWSLDSRVRCNPSVFPYKEMPHWNFTVKLYTLGINEDSDVGVLLRIWAYHKTILPTSCCIYKAKHVVTAGIFKVSYFGWAGRSCALFLVSRECLLVCIYVTGLYAGRLGCREGYPSIIEQHTCVCLRCVYWRQCFCRRVICD